MKDKIYQVMPNTGTLAGNIDVPVEVLSERLAPFRDSIVYTYVVTTVDYDEGRLFQAGSGPNFQGDLVTLCSCKHYMRMFRDREDWIGVWVAGFTSSTIPPGNVLFYLMKVSQAYDTHRELWESDCIPEETKIAKAAHLDRFGDIYRPKNTTGSPYSHLGYHEPCQCHVHCEPGDWGKDIDYPDRYGRKPALLVGDPEFSFLWDRPAIASAGKIGRGQKKTILADLLPI